MERYDYRQAMYDDIKQYIEENVALSDYEDKDEAYEALNKELWVTDSVTGNGSGSYWFNAWKAEEALCHNLDLLGEALEEFCCEPDFLKKGAEAADATIRCYLLGEVLQTVLDELWED